MLQKMGFETTWWTSDFAHHIKSRRLDVPLSSISRDGYRLELLRGVPYRTNVSVARALNNRQTASDFSRRADDAPRPDVILCSYPTIELSRAAVEYGRRFGVPVILDIRDLWPDIFLNLVPSALRLPFRAVLSSSFRASHRVCEGANAICGITDAFVDWGVRRAGRTRRETDRSFPLAYSAIAPPASDLNEARRYWDNLGVSVGSPVLCFFGMLGQQFDIPTVLEAAEAVRDQGIRFVICGSGDRLEEYRKMSAGLPNVIFPGWVSAAAVWTLMERSAAGLAPYHCEMSYTMSLPTKAIEYLAGGLPVLSSLSGELAALLANESCGLTYREGDVGSLVSMIQRLFTEPGLRAQMSENASRAYRSRFVAEVVYAEMIEYLAQIATSGNIRHAA